uniref:Fibronectin type-III domain-containing protein n=1 Tax=Romanomermis culicivorax TaxID=13658 RepID=A0A915HUE6_ROMCU
EHLQSNGEYEIRVAAKNSAGFGPPSQPVLVQLRPANQPVTPTEKVRLDSAVSSPPGQPRVVECDGHSAVRLIFEPPVYNGTGGPIHGYKIEYRVASSTSNGDDWITATDRLTTDNVFTTPIVCFFALVTGLRPNGDYEFRVIAKNLDGFSEPSRVSDVFRIRPFSDAIALNSANSIVEPIPVHLPAPGQPSIVDVGADWVTINWSPSVPGSLKVDRSNIHFLIECREKNDPTWCLITDKPTFGTQFTIANLRKSSSYEFRIIARNNRGDQSQPSKSSVLCHLSPKLDTTPSPVSTILRQVPLQPRPPEIVSVVDDCVTLQWCMEPLVPMSDQQRVSQKSAPLQGFQVEFRELSQPPSEWLAVNAILTHSFKMTVGDLEPQRRYEFRVTAKNAIGYSQPSDPSQSVFIGALTPVMEGATPPSQTTPNGLAIVVPSAFSNQKPKMPSPVHRDYSFNNDVPLPVEMSPAKESPPITDTDDSPPPIRRKPPGADGVTYRDPTLSEVLDYLGCNNNVLKLNASGYLQHLTYNELAIKHKVRELNGIPRVVDLLRNEVPEIQKNACGCLRNLCFGIDENKKAILNASGVPALANLLRKTPDMQILEEISSVLWNLSSHEDLKLPVLESCTDPLVRQIVVPYSGWSPDGRFTDHRQHPPAVFRNAVGVLRNVSSAGDGTARQTLRERPGLVDALCHYLHMSCDTGQVDAKSVENVICVIRNLTYRLQEMEDANYDKKSTLGEKSKSAPSSPKSTKKKAKQKKQRHTSRELSDLNENSASSSRHPLLKQPATGISLLWQPEVVRDYLKLLDQSSNPDTLEGSAGAIQNLAACYWQPSVDVRATVRKEKGLPILVALLSVDSDKVVCASATALRNLSLDQRNKELIGTHRKYAMEDLVKKLPSPSQATLRPSPSAPNGVSDETAAAVLSVVYATTVRSPDFTRTFLEKGGVERLVYLSNSRQYSHRVVKYSAQVLFAIWQHKELQDVYKKAGFREDDFVSRVGQSKNADTLARPVSTQGGAADKKRRSRQQQEQSRLAGIRPDFADDEAAVATVIEGGCSSRAAAIATPPRSNFSQEYETLDARNPFGMNQGSPYNHKQQLRVEMFRLTETDTNAAAYAQIQKKQTVVKQDLPVGQSTALKAQNGKNSSLTPAPQQPIDSWIFKRDYATFQATLLELISGQYLVMNDV